MDAIVDLVRRLGAPRVIGALLVTGAGVGAIWALVAWGNRPDMVPIVSDASMQSIVEARDALDAAGIDNDFGAGGAELRVRSADLARARVELAQRGVAVSERPGFELYDEPLWGDTESTGRIRFQRALEGELERSIGQMQGIRSAEVHLAMSSSSIYSRANSPVEASVLLRLGSGARPSGQQIEAITYLMASAVDGLTADGVSIVDDAGRVLSSAEELNATGRPSRTLELQVEQETRLETRVTNLLEQMLGAANARVAVAAELVHERVERRTDSVDPNEQVVTGEERSAIEPGDPSQGAASEITHTEFQASTSTELRTSMPGAIKRLTVSVLLNEDVPGAGDPAFLANVRESVSTAVGLDEARGDAISVVAVPFQAPGATLTPDPAPPGGGILDLVREFQRPAILILALVLAFVLALRGLSMARTALPDAQAALGAGGAGGQLSGTGAAPGLTGESGDVIVGGPNADPSRVVRAWLGEG